MLSVQNMIEVQYQGNLLVKTGVETLCAYSRLGRSLPGCRVGFQPFELSLIGSYYDI